MKKNNVQRICGLVVGASISTAPVAKEAIDILPSLFGGDGITLAPTANSATAHEAHFSTDTQSTVNELNFAIAREVRTLPVGSSSPGGKTFVFDPEQGTYVSSSRNLGPLLADSAGTLGKGNWSFAFTASTFEYQTFEGKDLDNILIEALHEDVPNGNFAFEQDKVVIELDVNVAVQTNSFFFTYGYTDQLDIGVIVPVITVDMEVKGEAHVEDNGGGGIHTFQGALDQPSDQGKRITTGLGDVLIAAKYYIKKYDKLSLASGMIGKLATGNQFDYLGTGASSYKPYMIADYNLSRLFTLHSNVGIELTNDGTGNNDLETVLGVTTGNNVWTVATEFVYERNLGNADIGVNQYDVGVGGKWKFLKEQMLYGEILLPLNDEGLRPGWTASLGYSTSF